MLKNEKGFSLIELLVIIFITSVVIWPIMTTLVGNMEINTRLHYRRSATGIAASALYGLDKMDYQTIDDLVEAEDALGNHFLKLDSNSCSLMAAEDQALCVQLFSLIFNDLTLTNEEFKIYIYDYNLPHTYYDPLILDENIPSEVRAEIAKITTFPTNPVVDFDLLRVTVWIQYSDSPVSIMTVSGLILR